MDGRKQRMSETWPAPGHLIAVYFIKLKRLLAVANILKKGKYGDICTLFLKSKNLNPKSGIKTK